MAAFLTDHPANLCRSGCLNHFKIILTDATLRALPIIRNVFPQRTWSNTLLRQPLFFIVHKATNYTFILLIGHDASSQVAARTDKPPVSRGMPCWIISDYGSIRNHPWRHCMAGKGFFPDLCQWRFKPLHCRVQVLPPEQATHAQKNLHSHLLASHSGNPRRRAYLPGFPATEKPESKLPRGDQKKSKPLSTPLIMKVLPSSAMQP
jgi:hypothetical protein